MNTFVPVYLRYPAIWFSALLLIMSMSAAEARQGEPPLSWRLPDQRLNDVPVLSLPAVDVQHRLLEDADAGGAAPLRFALPVPVSVTPASHGIWENLSGGGRLWRYRVQAPGATDLNFGFGRYRLPAGATLHIYSENIYSKIGRYYEGPYTAGDNKSHGQLWTAVIPGDRAVLELYLPSVHDAVPELTLIQVGTGYRDLFGRLPVSKQGNCNNDVICPEGDPWRDQIRSVARYTRNGAFLCTGSLIMDVPQSFRPFFLTAAHCGVSAGNAATVVIYWNFESPVCGQLGAGSLADNQSGAGFRAAEVEVDFTLLELDAMPDPAFEVFYAGWDRSGTVPQISVGIHHPGGDEKAISFNSDALLTGDSCIRDNTSNTHWYVDDWEDGTTETGSSGSGLFNPDGKRIVGFLSGGTAACNNLHGFDCYGKFSVAWDKGRSALSRLSDWLDPYASGVLVVEGSDPDQQQQVPVYDFSAAGFEMIEGNDVHTTTVVEVLRSGDISLAEDVTIALTGQTAVAAEDYTAGPVIITFATDQTAARVPVEIIGDEEPEPDETLQLSFAGFSAAGVAGITQPLAILTLGNDDVAEHDFIFSDQFED